MATTVLVVVDIQNDFCTDGALAVPDAEAVLPVVNGLIRDFSHVILAQDWHPPGHVAAAPPTVPSLCPTHRRPSRRARHSGRHGRGSAGVGRVRRVRTE